MSLVSFTQPLLANASVASTAYQMLRAISITGTVFADQAGTAYVDQGGDGTDWDFTTSFVVGPDLGVKIDVPVVGEWFRVRYVNGGSDQAVFRLFADPRDVYGAFLQQAQIPTPGGAFAVLMWQPGPATYSYVGRFDGFDAWDAIANAAIFSGANGKYAAWPVATAVVSDETIRRSTEHAPDGF